MESMESKKRPHADEDDPSITKKRILTSSNGSPQVNGIVADQEELPNGVNLELFRKEAIYRRMMHYSRENQRSQSRIAELERRKNTCEAGLAALSACWTQLVDTMRLLVKTDDLPQVSVHTKELFDLTTHISDDRDSALLTALEDNMNATQKLVTKFVQLGGGPQSSLLQDEAYLKCQTAQTECAALRSQIDVMRTKLEDSEAQKEKFHNDLIAAEIRAERLQSGTVLAMQARMAVEKQDPETDEIEEPQRKPSSPEPLNVHPEANGSSDPLESEDWQEIAKSKESKIVQLERESALLRDELNLLALELKVPSQEHVVESPHYKVLMEHASRLDYLVRDDREQILRLAEELNQLQASRKDFEDSVVNAAGQVNQELKTMLARRDAENVRLREQREQQAAELNERKHKDSVKLASMQELKALAESRSERIAVLESELKRHKAQIAANAGREDLMLFFFGGNAETVAYVEDLKNKVTAAETRAAALEQTLSIFQDDNPNVVHHMRAEADALQKLSEVTVQLEKYQRVYGDTSTLPPDVSKLADQARQKDAEIQRLRLLDTQYSQAETSLYAELDKLSAAWETLDRQVKNKVFDLMSMEDRLTKSGLDRAKSENKFYAAMRDKEAIEAERKNIARNLEKQAKVVERLVESEKNLTSQVSDLEREVVAWKKSSAYYKEKASHLDAESVEWKIRTEGEKKRTSELGTVLQERERAFDRKKMDLRKMEEEIIRSKKDLERQASKLKLAGVGTGSQKEVALQTEVDHLMTLLRCSTCKLGMRNTILTKCFHSFCKPCVDARISTRQRKCPACNIGFAQSDVQQLYFQ